MAKWWATEPQGRVVDRCLQLHGGYGYMLEYPIARAYADARVTRIYGGSNEIMQRDRRALAGARRAALVNLELTGRRAIVTGGSRGIGLAVGRALGARGRMRGARGPRRHGARGGRPRAQRARVGGGHVSARSRARARPARDPVAGRHRLRRLGRGDGRARRRRARRRRHPGQRRGARRTPAASARRRSRPRSTSRCSATCAAHARSRR